jgi:molybdate transport system regulatory protein
MHLVFKLSLHTDGKAFGLGPYELLSRVVPTGSLWQAAAEMGMSYTKAWRLVSTLEGRLGFLLLERHVGGRTGGGSGLTRGAGGTRFGQTPPGGRGGQGGVRLRLERRRWRGLS